MTTFKRRSIAVATVIGTGMLLAACTQSEVRLSPDFGQAVRQDEVAQIADPDAHYVGDPAPGSNGLRVELAQKRYVKNQVIQPSTLTAQSGATSADNGNSGGAGVGVGGASAGVTGQ